MGPAPAMGGSPDSVAAHRQPCRSGQDLEQRPERSPIALHLGDLSRPLVLGRCAATNPFRLVITQDTQRCTHSSTSRAQRHRDGERHPRSRASSSADSQHQPGTNASRAAHRLSSCKLPPMEHPGWILVPWAVFALAAAVKVWRLFAGVRQARRGARSNTEQFRTTLERIWQRQQLNT